jgi:phosphoribosylamine--glycine ligase
MKVLVVGGGGREHALVWAIWASPLVKSLYCAPGNAGIGELASCIPVAPEDVAGIAAVAKNEKIDFVVVGPEAPLAAGLVDRLEAEGIKAFGPNAKAAVLESSKSFMKELCRKHGIPAAAGESFRDFETARTFIEEQDRPLVVKADGLAAGKGVVVAENAVEAVAAAKSMLKDKSLGEAGAEIVIEERLEGEEVSFFALVDGEHALALASAQDHKRIGEGDTGVNTGGMGAYSPAPIMTPAMEARVMREIIEPTVRAMKAEGRPFKGVLFAGLMMTKQGPKVLEFNVRFGDPECQVLMPRLKSDLLPALIAARDGELGHFDLRWKDEAALCVVLAARGYPGTYKKGTDIDGLEAAAAVPGVTVFHAGTRREGKRIVSNGGRVLGVTALGATIEQAQARAYEAVGKIAWEDGYYRRDIGWRAVGRAITKT